MNEVSTLSNPHGTNKSNKTTVYHYWQFARYMLMFVLYVNSREYGYKAINHKVKVVLMIIRRFLFFLIFVHMRDYNVPHEHNEIEGNTQAADTGLEHDVYSDIPANTIEQETNKKFDDAGNGDGDGDGNGDADDVNNDQFNEPSGREVTTLPNTQLSACESKFYQPVSKEGCPTESDVRDTDRLRDNKSDYLLPAASADENQIGESESESKREPRICKDFPYDTLARATSDFDQRKRKEGGALIAAGNFGEVFYAVLDGNRLAAVKRLKAARSQRQSSKKLSKRQFTNELTALTMCPPHQNVVNLLGMSSDGPMLCLVYEYVGGGTLSEYLAADQSLVWSDRVKISTGVARALHHIHTSCSPPILHRDVKSCNILLLSDFTPVLTDFGLSCQGEFTDEPDASFMESGSTTVGTRCYMPPEAFLGIFCTRSDIYSFGMVLFEVITGMPPYSKAQKTDLITYLRDCKKQGTELLNMVDPNATWPADIAASLFELAMNCSNYDRHARPTASEALRHLDALM